MRGPWNDGDQWERVDDLMGEIPADMQGDGKASVEMDGEDRQVAKQFMFRTKSDVSSDPLTGADLGAGPGAGRTTNGDKGGAADIQEAAETARSRTTV